MFAVDDEGGACGRGAFRQDDPEVDVPGVLRDCRDGLITETSVSLPAIAAVAEGGSGE